ncbi:MAG: GAF domain-containing protein [Chloroflexi bacterium]|nr:GAF domain-containing protein [Chloroflexota bacterium]
MDRSGGGSHQRWLPYVGADDVAMRTMVDVCPVPTVIWSRADGTVLCANSVFFETLGIEPKKVPDLRFDKFSTDPGGTAGLLDKLDLSGAVDMVESTALRSDGSAFWISSSHRPVSFDDRTAVFTVFHDATDAVTAREADSEEIRRRAALAVISRVMGGSKLGRNEYERLAVVTYGVALFDRISINRIDAVNRSLSSEYIQGAALPGMIEGDTQPLVGTPDAYAASTRSGLLLADDDVESLLRFPTMEASYIAGLRSFLIVPLISNDKVLGTVSISSVSTEAYDAVDLEFLERVASHLAPAMERARLREALEQEIRERETMAAIGRVIGSSPDLSQMSNRFPRLIGSLLPADRIAISTMSVDEESLIDLYVYGIEVPERDRTDQHVTSHRSMLETMVEDGQTRYVTGRKPDDIVRQVPHLLPGFRAGLRSFLSVPLVVNETVFGALHLRSTEPDAYDEHQISLAEGISAQIAGVVAMSRLRASERRAEEERQALSDIAVAANKDLDLHRTFTRVATALESVIPYDRIEVALLEPTPGPLRRVFSKTRGQPGLPSGTLIDPGPLEGNAEDSRVWDSHLLSSDDLSEELDEDEMNSAVQAPLGVEKRRLGHIRLLSSRQSAYSNLSLQLLDKVVAYVTPAVQNALEHRQALELAKERERVSDLDARNQELERLSEAKNRFIATVSHELKTPLTSMLAFADILRKNRRGAIGETEDSQLAVIQRNGRRLALLIDDLLDLGRIERGDFSLSKIEFDAAELIVDMEAVFQPILETKRQTMAVNIPDGSLWLSADRERVAQVLSNLIGNASKYSRENTEISLTVRRRSDRLYVTVQDHGIGIPEHDLPNMFTSFFRADNEATRSESGTGLGLYIARNIVNLHEGRIEISSMEGEGTTVKFNLPGLMEEPSDDHLKLVANKTALEQRSRLDDLPKSIAS